MIGSPLLFGGWALVPIEPTDAMLEASWQSTRKADPVDRMRHELMDPAASHKLKARRRWAAMIDAAGAPNASGIPITRRTR